ncbi:MAG TPA: hypothetical protein VFI38_15340 [Candidatus Acidoferrum sp.]|nr:hypothetical protein [Candidatus Acidoferrum sp.]
MSYDFYSYRSSRGQPLPEEAQGIIEKEEETTFRDDPEAREIKEKIAAALLNINPRLERFVFDYSKIADSLKISEEQARLRYNHIEMNPPEGDLVVQVSIFEDHVAYSIPYWYGDSKGDLVFAQLLAYLKAVRETAGFLAYDPQSDRAFDPLREEMMSDNSDYKAMSANLPALVAQGMPGRKKPWWKFW